MCSKAFDVVFVMDVSTSMGPFFDKLESEILAVDDALRALNLMAEPRYGLVVFVDDTEVANGGASYADAAALQADFMQWNAFTSSNRQIQSASLSNMTMPENSLDALFRAAGEWSWRPFDVAERIVIHTTDDTFWDGPLMTDGVMVEHGYAETVSALQSQRIRVFAFSALQNLLGSDVTPGWSSPYMGMAPIPEATNGQRFGIRYVLDGTTSLAQAIPAAVEEVRCDPYPVG